MSERRDLILAARQAVVDYYEARLAAIERDARAIKEYGSVGSAAVTPLQYAATQEALARLAAAE